MSFLARDRTSFDRVPITPMSLFIGRDGSQGISPVSTQEDRLSNVCQGRRRIGEKAPSSRHCAKEADHFLVFEGLPPR